MYGRKRFKLDSTKPLDQQQGEPDQLHQHFKSWVDAGFPNFRDEDFANSLGVQPSSVARYNRLYSWSTRRDLAISQNKATAPQKANVTALKAPEPIDQGIHEFALKYGEVISPGFQLDAVVDAMLTELEALIEGKAGGRLMVNPPPRHSKTTCAILALCYSLLRYPDRGHILISANGRLSALNCALMRTLFEYAAPEGYGIKTDQKSKLAWSPNWEGARTQLAASRGAALLGYTGHIVLVDDIVGNIGECESVESIDASMRTIGVDVMTRLTKDKAGKGQGLILIAQRLSPNDPTARMIERDKAREKAGEKVVAWNVLASPMLSPDKDEKLRILNDYPASWNVKFPRFGEPGEPVSQRFSKAFAEELEAQMPPQDFAAMYKLDTRVDVGYCSWRRSYLVPIEPEAISCRGSFIALDLNLAGDKGSDTSALVAVGVQDQKAVILGVNDLLGHVEDVLPQVLDYADRYNAHTLGVEKAAGGHFVLRSLNNNVAGRTFNVVALSHEGRSKRNRQAKILGLAASGKVLIRSDCPLIETLHQQQRSIALDKKKDADDFADAMNYAVAWVNTHWLSSGFSPGEALWQGGPGTTGTTLAIWGRGSKALMKPIVGIDGVTRYSIAGFS